MAPDPYADPFADEVLPALGVVLTEGRGALPFALLHGESLVACAAWAMGAAEIELVDFTVGWAAVRDAGRPLVLHDALCPATPADFLARAVGVARATGRVVVGARPVTDTVKTLTGTATGTSTAAPTGARIGDGPDRETLAQLASPVVLPAEVVAELERPPLADDPDGLLEELLGRLDHDAVEWLEAPEAARRIADEDDLRVLEAATQPRP